MAAAKERHTDGVSPATRKVVETVDTDANWCCITRSSSFSLSSSSVPSSPKSKNLRRLCAEEDRRRSRQPGRGINVYSGDFTEPLKVEKKPPPEAGDSFKNGEIAALIKQGFISGTPLDRGNGSPFRIRLSPGRVSPLIDGSSSPIYPAGYSKLNMLLTSGFLNQSSPPIEKTRSSPTLFEMMVNEPDAHHRPQFPSTGASSSKQLSLQERIISAAASPGNQFNDPSSSDLRLTLTNREDFHVSLNLHSQVLVDNSRYFAAKLSEKFSKQQPSGRVITVEIADCEDVEMYVETVRLMYCKDLKRRLLKESVSRVLGILKISAALEFEAGILACLEFLEAVPWAEEEEEKVTSLLSQLQLKSIGAGEVLQRLSTNEDPGGPQDILVCLVHLITTGTDEKARKEMKGLVSRMLRENAVKGRDCSDLSKENLYQSCQGCLESLLHLFTEASNIHFISKTCEERGAVMAHITRQADNLNWLVDILIDRQLADDFVKIWAYQSDLTALHSQIPVAFGRYEVSRLTARLCIAVGKGQILAPKEARFTLLQNWLQPLIDDFGWMQRACKGLDRKMVEEGISQTILTLPLKQQQTIMLAWFDRFLKSGDDCPNLHRAFETWWRRTFVRPHLELPPSPERKQ